MRRFYSYTLVFCVLATLNFRGFSQQQGSGTASTPPPASDQAQELAKQLQNPVANLISFPIQSNFDFKVGPDNGFRYTANIQR